MFYQDVFKVVFCSFVLCGKRVKRNGTVNNIISLLREISRTNPQCFQSSVVQASKVVCNIHSP